MWERRKGWGGRGGGGAPGAGAWGVGGGEQASQVAFVSEDLNIQELEKPVGTMPDTPHHRSTGGEKRTEGREKRWGWRRKKRKKETSIDR